MLRLPFRLRFLHMEQAAPFRLDGEEQNGNVTIFFYSYCIIICQPHYMVHVHHIMYTLQSDHQAYM